MSRGAVRMAIKYEPRQIYRGVQVHGYQTATRIERVKCEIDRVIEFGDDIDALFRHIADVSKPPESRLLGAAMLEALFNDAVENRRERPSIDVSLVKAHV